MRVLSNLTIGRKLALMGAIAFVPVITLVYTVITTKNRDIAFLEMEVVGTHYLQPVHRLLRHIAEHRGMMNALLNGGQGFANEVVAKRAEIALDLQDMDTAETGYGEDLKTGSAGAQVRAAWAGLMEQVSRLEPEQSFARHTAIIANLLRLVDHVGDTSNLTLDSDLGSAYLMDLAVSRLPVLSEELGALRGKASGIAAQRSLDDQAYAGLAGRLGRTREQVEGIKRIVAVKLADPGFSEVQARLLGPLDSLRDRAGDFGTLIEAKILRVQGGRTDIAPSEVFAAGTTAVAAAYDLYDTASAIHAELLEARMDRLMRDKYLTIAQILGFMLLVTYSRRVIGRSITGPIQEAGEIAQRVASGNLTSDIKAKGRDEGAWLLHELKAMQKKLTEVTVEVRRTAAEVYDDARQIIHGNAELSSRTEEQAASLQEIASGMEEFTGTVLQNANNAYEASQLAFSARERAERGGAVVGAVVAAMAEINAAAERIADIVGVIDEIAFQSNILALNAAIEAARAGAQGRGFAVVASEVRNLAQRSAGAAQEIKGLIEDSVSKVEDGTRLVDQSGAALAEIVTSVTRVSDFIAEIAAASEEQSSGIELVNRAVTESAALVEQASAAGQSFDEHAHHLTEVMGYFKLPDDQPVVAAGPATPELPPERRRPDRPWSGTLVPVKKLQTAQVLGTARRVAARVR